MIVNEEVIKLKNLLDSTTKIGNYWVGAHGMMEALRKIEEAASLKN